MRSIRRSLGVYLVGLMALALGAGAALVEAAVSRTLRGQLASHRELVQARCEDHIRREHARLDEELLSRARTLASLTQAHHTWGRGRLLSLTQLGVLSAAASPQGHLLAPAWIAETAPGPLSWRVYRMFGTEIALSEELLPHDWDDDGPVYFQIATEYGVVWRSASLAGRSLPASRDQFNQLSLLDWRFDELPGESSLRRVTLKVPVIARVRFAPGPPPPPDRNPPMIERNLPGRERSRPGNRRPEPPRPIGFEAGPATILVQAAQDTHPRNEMIRAHQAERDARLAELNAEAEQTLAGLRLRLGLMGLAAFVAVFVGGWALVGAGLAPLRRLSAAVGQVSPRDFRLSFAESRLPTELVPIVSRLNTTLADLGQAFDREKQATADISHELRTPLAALQTMLDVCLRKPRSVEEYRSTLARCRDVGKQLTAMVERLLTLARLDAGTLPLVPQRTDIAALANSCGDLIRPLADVNGVSLTVTGEPTLPLTTDPDRLREVLTNLLHNAVSYNRPGGWVKLTIGKSGSEAVLEVADSGIGMTPEVAGKVFERFYRADPARHQAGQHAGLGLAIVKESVARLNGRVELESTPDVGSTFRVRLPLVAT